MSAFDPKRTFIELRGSKGGCSEKKCLPFFNRGLEGKPSAIGHCPVQGSSVVGVVPPHDGVRSPEIGVSSWSYKSADTISSHSSLSGADEMGFPARRYQ